MYKLKFHKEVRKDLKKIDKSILNLFEKKLSQILDAPDLWIDLWYKLGLNLSWFKKIYFAGKKYRIVYKVCDEEILVYIVSVWKRENFKVYKEAFNRLK